MNFPSTCSSRRRRGTAFSPAPAVTTEGAGEDEGPEQKPKRLRKIRDSKQKKRKMTKVSLPTNLSVPADQLAAAAADTDSSGDAGGAAAGETMRPGQGSMKRSKLKGGRERKLFGQQSQTNPVFVLSQDMSLMSMAV